MESTVVGIYSATGKVAFAINSVVLYIEQICILRAIILRDDDFSFALYTPTTVDQTYVTQCKVMYVTLQSIYI